MPHGDRKRKGRKKVVGGKTSPRTSIGQPVE